MSKRPVLTDSAFSSKSRKRVKRPDVPIPSRGTQILTEPASVSSKHKQPEPIVHRLADYDNRRINRLLRGARSNRGGAAVVARPAWQPVDNSAFYEAPLDLAGFHIDNPAPRSRTRKVFLLATFVTVVY